MKNATQDKINRQEKHLRREERHEQKRNLREQRHQNRRFQQNMSPTSTGNATTQRSILPGKWFRSKAGIVLLLFVAAIIIWITFSNQDNISYLIVG